MRRLTLLLTGLAAAAALWAQPVSKSQDRSAAVYNGPRVQVASWIYTPKITYNPGESITLRGTVKTNGDLYPYTTFLYLQNNQTGVKLYYPGFTSEVTDVNGRTAAQGFSAAPLTDASKAQLATLNAPADLGMHSLVREYRDYTGSRVLKADFHKFGVVSGAETISGNITQSRTLTNDKQWNIQGIVYVKSGAVLTIDPGTFIVGQPGSNPASAVIITRTGTIEAHGTKARPIVMTSAAAVGDRTRGGNGGWGGLVLLGRAPINVPAGSGGTNNQAGEFYIEGLQTTEDALYGGTDPTHYCGTLEYVRVEFAGSILAAANELNSMTFGGCGTKTVAHHLQAHNGLDDAFEFFGGTMNIHHIVAGVHADDYFDYQLGYRGKMQFALFYQDPSLPGNRGIEGDNSEYTELGEPFSSPTIFNATFVGAGVNGPDEGAVPGLYLRRGTRGSFNNIAVTRFPGGGAILNDANTQAQATNGQLFMNGILFWKNLTGTANSPDTLAGNIAPATGASSAQTFTLNFLNGTPAGGARNIMAADPLMARPFEPNDPDFTGLFGSALLRVGWATPPDDGFFDPTAKYIGGADESDRWWDEWTRFPLEAEMK